MDEIFKALSEKHRRIILTLLIEHGGMTVSQILLKMNSISQPTLSNHLAVLKKSKLVDFEVVGKWRRYVVNRSIFESYIRELTNFIGNGNMAEIKARRS